MLYHYLASNKEGKFVEGDFDAENLQGVLGYLSARNLRPISIKAFKKSKFSIKNIFVRITVEDKVFLVKYLSLMLKVGTDLLSAINILIADFDNPSMRSILLEVRDNLINGRPFYKAFEKYPKYFSPVFVNLLKAAESSGNLQKTLDDLSKSLEREADIRNRIRSALAYPIILLIVAASVFIFLVTFALPRVSKVFMQSNINPPVFSRIVFGVGNFINSNLTAIVISLFLIFAPLIYFFGKNVRGKRVLNRILGSLPLLKKIYHNLAIQRFASTLSSLLRAGLPIIDSLRITASVVGLDEYRVALLRIANEGLTKGLTIGEAFKKETVFPRTITNLVEISEKAGHLESVLDTLSEFYASNINSSIKILVSILEPIMLIFLGAIVGTIALSIIVPIYQLTSKF